MNGLKSLYKTSGIYEIRNIVNNKRYIGQSQNMYVRISKHIFLLRSNNHCNKHLQSAWNQYGENSFECSVLEYCSNEQLNEKELFWIDYYKSNNKDFGYNIRLNPFDNRGLKWTDEQREKMIQHINEDGSYYRNHIIPKETLEKAWQSSRNKIWSDEERDRHSKILTGTKVTDTRNMKIAQTGETNNYAKLKQCDVEEIICLLNLGYSQTYLSKLYSVSLSTIHAIKSKRSWTHLNLDYINNNNMIKNRALKRFHSIE